MRPNFSGFDGRVLILAREEGMWRVTMFSSAGKALLEKAILETGRGREFKRHMERLTLRYNTGLWVGDDGKIIDSTPCWKGSEHFQGMELTDYTTGQFADVDENAWYGAEKQGAVELACQMRLAKQEYSCRVRLGIRYMSIMRKRTPCCRTVASPIMEGPRHARKWLISLPML